MPSLPYTIEALVLQTKRGISWSEDSDDSSDADYEQDDTSISIIPDVIISEDHIDEVVVTRHPVDFGAPVADHAYKQPAEIHCSFGWSDSSILINSALDGSILKGFKTTRDVYEKFIELMDKRQELKLGTGKRQYDRVIITKIQTVTTADTESSLILDVTFQEILTALYPTVSIKNRKQQDASLTGGVKDIGLSNVKAYPN